jgi:hypothetical protein
VLDIRKMWVKVDSLEKLGLPESSLKVVEEIYSVSKGEGNRLEYIKAVTQKKNILLDLKKILIRGALEFYERRVE